MLMKKSTQKEISFLANFSVSPAEKTKGSDLHGRSFCVRLVPLSDQLCQDPKLGTEFHITVESLVFLAVIIVFVFKFDIQPGVDFIRIVIKLQTDILIGQVTKGIRIDFVQAGGPERKRNRSR